MCNTWSHNWFTIVTGVLTVINNLPKIFIFWITPPITFVFCTSSTRVLSYSTLEHQRANHCNISVKCESFDNIRSLYHTIRAVCNFKYYLVVSKSSTSLGSHTHTHTHTQNYINYMKRLFTCELLVILFDGITDCLTTGYIIDTECWLVVWYHVTPLLDRVQDEVTIKPNTKPKKPDEQYQKLKWKYTTYKNY